MTIKSKLAVDAMIFIYHFDRVEPYFTYTSKILSEAQRGQHEIVTSIISVIEILSPKIYRQTPDIIKEINIYFKEANYLHVIDVNWDIAQETARLRRLYPALRTPDAIQIATALIAKADTFATNDKKLGKLRITGLKIHSLD